MPSLRHASMDIEDIRTEIEGVVDPELGPDDDVRPTLDLPHDRLETHHGLDLSYLKTYRWEGSTIHPSTRTCAQPEPTMKPLTHNVDVPKALFEAALRLFADSILAYHGRSEHKGDLRYYPPVVLTFWSGFETFVRFSSEILLLTVPSVPPPVAAFLRDSVLVVEKDGTVKPRRRVHPVLDRYVALLRYGYGYKVDRGAPFWQRLDQAKNLRDYYTHLDVTEPRSLSSAEVLDFMESVLLGIIVPSVQLKRTQLLGVYHLYRIWATLEEHAEHFVERPFFHDWVIPETQRFSLYCPFEGVDRQRFPNSDDEREHGDESD